MTLLGLSACCGCTTVQRTEAGPDLASPGGAASWGAAARVAYGEGVSTGGDLQVVEAQASLRGDAREQAMSGAVGPLAGWWIGGGGALVGAAGHVGLGAELFDRRPLATVTLDAAPFVGVTLIEHTERAVEAQIWVEPSLPRGCRVSRTRMVVTLSPSAEADVRFTRAPVAAFGLFVGLSSIDETWEETPTRPGPCW